MHSSLPQDGLEEFDLIVVAVGSGNASGGGTATTITADESGWNLLNPNQTALPATASTSCIFVFSRLASASETTYGFTPAVTSDLVAVTVVYRNSPINCGDSSTLNTGTSTAAQSPTLALTGTALVLSIAAKNDGTNGTFTFPGGVVDRGQAGISSTDPDGIRIAFGDLIGAMSSPARTWTNSSDAWGALTIHFFANEVREVVSRKGGGHPQRAAAVNEPVFIQHELR